MLRATHVFEPTHPVHLGQTLAPLGRGKADPLYREVPLPRGGTAHWVTAHLDGIGVVARFTRLPARSAGAQSASSSPGSHLLAPVEVTAWTDGRGEVAQAALEHFLNGAPAWVGEQDHWSSFYSSPAWEQLPARLKDARAQHPGLRLPSTRQLLPQLILAITEQRITTGEAARSIRTILHQCGTPAPATGEPDQPAGLISFPSPGAIAAIPSWDWHRAGYDRARSDAIVTAARQSDALERTASTSGMGALARALATLPGLGPWTIAETLQRYCGHPDAISVGDYHLAHHVTYAFDGVRGDDARMLALLAPYAGHRQRVIALIKAAGIQEPRRAPRLTPQDHRRH